MATNADAGTVYGTLGFSVSINPAGNLSAHSRKTFTLPVASADSLFLANVPSRTVRTYSGRHVHVARFGQAEIQAHSYFLAREPKFFQTHDIAKNYAPGALINGGDLSVSKTVLLDSNRGGVARGQFPLNETGFLGFETAGGDLGWLEVQVLDRNSDGYPDEVNLVGYAYNTTSGGSISTPTPEPGTAALGLLAGGAAGLLALRARRRKQTQD
jgi:hypothetical protein